MNIRETKKKALKVLKAAADNNSSFFFIYLGMAVILWIYVFCIDKIGSFGYILILCSFYIIGKIDLEKAAVFMKLSKNEKIYNFGFSELSGKIPHNVFNNIMYCYYKKYFILAVLFTYICMIPIVYVIGIIEDCFIGGKSMDIILNDPAGIKYVFSGIIAICIFIFFLIKYFFVDYIVAEKCSELLENGGKFKGDKMNRYDVGLLAAAPDFKEMIYNENKRLVSENLGKIIMLTLSFTGWFLLSLLTLGLGFAFTAPYFSAASAVLYTEIKERKERL